MTRPIRWSQRTGFQMRSWCTTQGWPPSMSMDSDRLSRTTIAIGGLAPSTGRPNPWSPSQIDRACSTRTGVSTRNPGAAFLIASPSAD